MNEPRITIGITSYNAADTLARAVRSAQAQTWENTEILIVDDASDDETPSVLEALLQDNPAITVIRHNENKGVAAARNTLLAQAKGEFVAFFDDDDVSLPTRLQQQYKRMTEYETRYAAGAPVICHTARLQTYPDGTRRTEPTMGTRQDVVAPHGGAVARRMLTGRPVADGFGSTATCSQMARTQTYRALGGFDESFKRSEDTEFNIRAALAGAHFPGLHTPLVEQTMTRASDKKLADEKTYALKLLDKHKAYINQQTSYNFCHEWLVAKYDFLQGNRLLFLGKMLSLLVRHPLLTLQRLWWALPNTGFNLKFKQFHNDRA